MFKLFLRTPLSVKVADDLYEAETQLLSARYNLEHWRHTEAMMVDRVNRLRNHLDDLRAEDSYPSPVLTDSELEYVERMVRVSSETPTP
jgi:hypothetical protein